MIRIFKPQNQSTNPMPKKRSRLAPSVRTKVTRRTILFMTAAFLAVTIGMIVTLNFKSQYAYAVASGDYRTATSGNWNSTSTWQTYNGSAWVAAAVTPDDAAGTVTILNGHTVTVTANVAVDEFVIDAGGSLVIQAGKTLDIINGTGTDLLSNGTITIAGTLDNKGNSSTVIAGNVTLQSGGANTYAAGATITINSGGRYKSQDATCTYSANIWTVNSGGVFQQDINGGNLPLATWNAGSTCEVTGVTTTKPGNLDQSFYHFTWNCPSQTSVENLGGKLEVIGGDFNFISTGTGYVRLGNGENYTLNIGGNYYHQGGELHLTSKSLLCVMNIGGNFVQTGGTFAGNDVNQDNGDGSPTISVSGNFTISSGTIDFSQYTGSAANKGITTLNLYGNYTQTGGTLTETATNTGKGDVYFKKTGTQYYSKTSGTASNLINYTIVSGSVVDVGTSVFTSSGTFTLSSGGGVNLGSANGITQTAASGNVQVTGTRSYSTGADYTYNGTVAQVTGDGLPATVRYFTVYNNANLTLTKTVSVSSILYLTLGDIITNTNELVVKNPSASSISGYSSNSYVIGNLRRNTNSSGTYDFPLGATYGYQLLSVILSSTAGFTDLLGTFVPGDPAPGGIPNGLLRNGKYFNKMLNNGYWSLNPNSTMTSGSYGVALYGSGFSNKNGSSSNDPSEYTTLKRAGSGNNWDLMGTTDVTKQVVSDLQVVTYTTGYTTFSHFGQGTGGSTLPIKLMAFDAKLEDGVVKFNWTTAAEINNDFFTIERSTDGKKYSEVVRQQGAGNSTITLYYADRDENPSKGYNYYRLKQTDYDGHFSYSDVKTVKVKKNAMETSDLKIESVYPNPFTDNFKVSFTMKKSTTVDVLVLNANGQIIAKDKMETVDGLNTYEFTSAAELKNGIYFVTLLYNDQKVVQKIIRN